MKRISAAVAAVVVVGAVFAGSPAFASQLQAPARGENVSLPSGDRPSPGYTEEVAPAPHPLDLPGGSPSAAGAKAPSAAASPQGDSGAQAAPTGTASIVGRVVASDSGQPVAQVEVSAIVFDADGEITFQSTVTADGNGQFTIPDLAANSYWLHFYAPDVSGTLGVQWWGSSILNPYGTKVVVADGETKNADWTMSPSGIVQGTVTCEQCTGAPDPSVTDVSIDVPDPNVANHYIRVATLPVDGDGKYISYVIYANNGQYPHYLNFVHNSGSKVLSPTSYGDVYTVSGNSTSTSNLIISHLINPVPGFSDQYGMADNSVVNALYWDFLNRLPSVSEATGWVRLLYNGTEPSAVSAGFVNSDEYRLIRIDAAYQNILGRASDPSGRADWLNNMKAGRITTDDIETSFYASAEYFAKHGGTNVSFTQSLYTTLLHRPGSSSEWNFWANLAAKNGRDWVIKQFWDAPETIGERVSLMYAKYLGRTPDAAGLRDWVNVALAIGDSGLRSGLSGSEEYFIRSQYRYSES